MSTLVIGFSSSLLLFILAAGLTIIFGMLGVINFAHGSIYMLGAYLSYQFANWTGNFWIALVGSAGLCALFGALIERKLIRRTYAREHVYQLLLTFGLILVIESAIRMAWGQDYKHVAAPDFFSHPVELFGSLIPAYRLFVIAIGLILSVFLVIFLDRSWIGVVIRAASSDPEMASALGVDTNVVRTAVFSAGSALAGLAGAIAAPLVAVDLGMGLGIIIDCFMVVIIGGLGSVTGAILASFLIGMTRAIGFTFAPEWVDVITFGVLIAALLFRPQGLLAHKERLA